MAGPGRPAGAGRGCAESGQVCKCRWLDTLILQAHLMEPIFNAKVRQLASAANGYFYVGNTGAGVDFASAHEWRASSRSLKSVDRAVEKCTRSYQGDVSQLLDCVRQCIVFDKMSDVLQAMRVIAGDSQLQLLRLKNRLSRRSVSRDSFAGALTLVNARQLHSVIVCACGPERCYKRDPWLIVRRYDACRLSGGYRDLLMNLRVKNDLTQKLGLDLHVCELQVRKLSFDPHS